MSTWWSAGEFRRARIGLVMGVAASIAAVSVQEWASACLNTSCERDPRDIDFELLLVGVIHLGLVISLTAERGGTIMRLFGIVLLLPSATLAGAGFVFFSEMMLRPNLPFIDTLVVGALTLGFALAHLVQFWALIGIPFPRLPSLPPLAPSRAPAGEETLLRVSVPLCEPPLVERREEQ
jgi:hypothetical protein